MVKVLCVIPGVASAWIWLLGRLLICQTDNKENQIFLIYDFATDPFWTSLYTRKILFYQCRDKLLWRKFTRSCATWSYIKVIANLNVIKECFKKVTLFLWPLFLVSAPRLLCHQSLMLFTKSDDYSYAPESAGLSKVSTNFFTLLLCLNPEKVYLSPWTN